MKRLYLLGVIPLLLFRSCGITEESANIEKTSVKKIVTLPFEIDKTGCITRFLGTDENSKDIIIPESYSIRDDGKYITGDSYQIKAIGDYCFANNNLIETVSIPNNVEIIGAHAFENCPKLHKINVTSNITSIGDNAFNRCPSLTTITRDGTDGMILSENDHLSKFSIPTSITKVDDYSFNGWDLLDSMDVVNSVKYIGNNAFSNCSVLHQVAIKGCLEELGDGCFASPKLTGFGTSVSFDGIQNVKRVIIPDNFYWIKSTLFYKWEQLEEVSIPSSVVNHDFGSGVTVPVDETQTRKLFFKNRALKKLTIPNISALKLFVSDSVDLYGRLSGDDLNWNYYTSSLKEDGSYLYNYYIPTTLTEIHVTSGKSLESYCFYRMKSLKSVYLPNGILSFGRSSFADCSGLIGVHMNTAYDWQYESHDYGFGTKSGTISKSTMNKPNALASALKQYGSDYEWKAIQSK